MNKKDKKDISILFIGCLFISIIFYSPYLISAFRGYRPELRFLGDLHLIGFPAFIQSGKYFSEYAYYGIDFFTGNGSSAFFIRPNLTTYFPPQLILETIFRASNTVVSAKLFTVLIWTCGCSGMFFTALWMRFISNCNVLLALSAGVLYISLISYVFSQPGFFYVACTFPILLYCLATALCIRTDNSQKILLTLPLVTIITAGYLPIAVMGIVLAILTTLFLPKICDIKNPKYIDLLKVIVYGSLVNLLYLVAVFDWVSIVSAVPKIPMIESVYFDQLSLTYKSVIAMLFPSYPNDSGEAPHFRLGLPLILTLCIGYKNLKNHQKYKNIFLFSILIFLLSALLGMGRVSGLADIFFYTVPGLGGMHIYARYMLITVFYLALALVIGLNQENNSPFDMKIPLFLVFSVFICIVFFPNILISNKISISILFIEIFISILIIITYQIISANTNLIIVALLVVHQASFLYMNTNWMSLENTGNSYKDVVNDNSRTENLLNYFYSNSNKLFIKYIDITPEIEKSGGISQNFPWNIRYSSSNGRRISSYMGYDQALSHQKEYAQKFSYFGKYDKKYLLDTGLDFIIYNLNTKNIEKEWLQEVVDSSIPEFNIGNGYFVSKIKDFSGGRGQIQLNNGLFTVQSNGSEFIVDNFETDWAASISLTYEANLQSELLFNLFPQKYWVFKIDGQKLEPIISPVGTASFMLPAGKHIFTVSYKNYPNQLFAYLLIAYLLFIFIIINRFLLIFIYKINMTKFRKKL